MVSGSTLNCHPFSFSAPFQPSLPTATPRLTYFFLTGSPLPESSAFPTQTETVSVKYCYLVNLLPLLEGLSDKSPMWEI